jgi:hypothetical protein
MVMVLRGRGRRHFGDRSADPPALGAATGRDSYAHARAVHEYQAEQHKRDQEAARERPHGA